MKRSLFYVFSFALLAVFFAAPSFAQSERISRNVSAGASQYVISAKAGGVNFVEGKVAVTRKAGRSGLLLKGDALEIGDKVSTATGGKAEILLNPGSFARIAEKSEFELATTSLEDLQLKLNAGSAIFEVITDDEFTFAVNTPKAKFMIVKTGVYRVDVLSDGTSKIEVWKGKAQIGDVYATEVKSGREAVVNGAQVTVAKFDRDEKDEFEIFSKTRAKELAKVNAQLQNRDVRTSLMSSFYNTRWSLNDSYGLWVFNPRFGNYAFLPFGYGWNSPYGYYYNCDIWRYNLPPVIYYPPVTNTPVKVGDADTNTGRVRINPPTRAPYEKIQSQIGRTPIDPGVDSAPSFPMNTGRQPSSSFPINTGRQPASSPPSAPDKSASDSAPTGRKIN